MDSVLELVNAELVKSTTALLDHVCWETETEQHWVVLGPNGAGKTSLMRATSDRFLLNGGNATLDSQDLKGIGPAELATRVVFVSKSFAPSIRGGQRVLDSVHTAAWGISIHRRGEYEAEDEVRCRDLLEVFGVSRLAQHEFCTLLEGEAQQVPLVHLLTSDPEVLILDELGAGLDLEARESLLSAPEEIMSGTRAPQVVLVIHQMEDTPAGITHVVIMARGRIAAQGSIDETFTGVNPSHTYGLPLSTGCDAGRWRARGLKRS